MRHVATLLEFARSNNIPLGAGDFIPELTPERFDAAFPGRKLGAAE